MRHGIKRKLQFNEQ